MKIKIKKLSENAVIPEYKTEGAAGFDVTVLLDRDTEVLGKGEIKLFRTGLAMALPSGYEAQVRSRSGLSLKNGIIVLNAPGTIDSDYRGEIGLIVMNCGKEDFIVENKMRLAQIVVAKCEKPDFEIVDDLDSTERGEGAYGHTGT
ncbi:MAG: dUTP diphosphatase [Rickettsiales bacterium]|jgi:dUTP pyrophosphatase|nr:dUTP diphosphatase [Rickettsiales bacterium]